MTRVIAALAAIPACWSAQPPQLSWNSPSKRLPACHTVDKKLVGPAYRMSPRSMKTTRTRRRGWPRRYGRAESASGARSDAGQPAGQRGGVLAAGQVGSVA